MMLMLMKIDHISKTYSGDRPVRALSGVSLEMHAGQFIAIRGPSGCGKSTLLLTAGTLLAPDSGEVSLFGEQPYKMSGDARATFRGQHLGFVFQQFHLVPYLSVLENVIAPTLATDSAVPTGNLNSARVRACELLDRFGLGDRTDHTPAKLSSGERQRCALARALFNQPKLLLADEPTGNLDPDNATIVLEAMRRFADDGGAVLLVTHDDRAAASADTILWMNQGVLSQPEPVTP
jgi:putative ABC transport system ATP-binding protein